MDRYLVGLAVHGARSAGHLVPLLAARRRTRRARERLPPPHLRVHAPQSDQRETAQRTGQSPPVLQYCVSESGGHALPPLSGRRDTTRTRPCSPPPHEAEQRLHWPQLDVAQSVLQACGLQKVCCLSDGQLPKVFLGEVTTRVRVFVPTPQRRL